MSSNDIVRRYNQGESVQFDVPVVLANNMPATADNCTALLTLRSPQCSGIVWQADLYDGLTAVSPGTIRVIVPQRIADTLRRGSFIYALTVTDKRSKLRRVYEEGTLLIEYVTTSPNPDLGYKPMDGDQTTP
jgi:hypothetical protein